MAAPGGKQFNFDRDAQSVFNAILATAQQGKQYELAGLHNESRRLVVHKKRSLMSWGNFFFVQIADVPGGSVVSLVVTGIPGAPQALLDGRNNRKAAEKFVEESRTALNSGTQSEPLTDFMIGEDGQRGPWDESLLQQ